MGFRIAHRPPADSVDRSCAAAPLTSLQKQRLAMISRDAYAKQPQIVRGETKFDLWRHAQAIKCCGRRISEAVQGDYLALKAHFLDLAGKPVAAMQAHQRGAMEPHRVALHKLARECAAKGLTMAYPAAICRTQYRCALEDATAKQIWRLVFTIRNRKRPAVSTTTVAKAQPEPEDENMPF